MTNQAEWQMSREELSEKIKKQSALHYYGDGGEHLLLASLSRRQYDAMKLPVDYGFDIMAFHREDILLCEPGRYNNYFFQVKAITVKEQQRKLITVNQSKRLTVSAEVHVSGFTLNLIKKHRNMAIVVYIYDEKQMNPKMELADSPVMYFWLNGEDVGRYSDCIERPKVSRNSNSGGYFSIPFQIVYPGEAAKAKANNQHVYVCLGREISNDGFLGKNDRTEKEINHFSLSDFFRAATVE